MFHCNHRGKMDHVVADHQQLELITNSSNVPVAMTAAY
jgi:hypothetical protein